MATKKTVLAGYKSWITRRAREAFLTRYGAESYHAIMLLSRGRTTEEVGEELGVENMVVGAWKANLTRGTYDKYLKNCNF